MMQADLEPGLLDTSLFVYAYDPTDPGKRSRAQRILQQHIDGNSLILSVQVLNEFYRAATRPNRPPSLSHEEAAERIHLLAEAAEVLSLKNEITFRALEGVGLYQLALWDAVLWATAEQNGIARIYTEDIPGVLEIEGVRYVNPFEDQVDSGVGQQI